MKWKWILSLKFVDFDIFVRKFEFNDILFQEHPDDIRNRKMKVLYGEHASQIHAKETAMQLSFVRISTLRQPVLWPNIPLKLKF